MLNAQVSIRFLIEDLLFGGPQQLTELMSMLVSRFNLIWQESLCTVKSPL